MSELVGQSVDRYQIIEKLGQGGMATVYKAFDSRLERYVAIKFIRAEAINEVFLKRFEREAKALAKLSHPNIVKIHDYGSYDGMPYLVMEYLPGGTLRDKLGRKYTWQEAVELILPLAHTLAYIHKQHIIHRDVKPSNFLITESGQPMLSDFGIAKMIEAEETLQLTGAGMGIGTPEYMAPEQGMGGEIDHRADIYSLGIVFYELVTGKKPFSADTPMAVMVKQISEPLPSPRQFLPALPDEVERVLVKALAKRAENRYQSMDEFASALENLLTSKPAQVSEAQETLIEPYFSKSPEVKQPQQEVPVQFGGETRVGPYPMPQVPARVAAQKISKPQKKSGIKWFVIAAVLGVLGCGLLVGGGLLANMFFSQQNVSHTATAEALAATIEAMDRESTQLVKDKNATATEQAFRRDATATEEAYRLTATAESQSMTATAEAYSITATAQMSHFQQIFTMDFLDNFEDDANWSTGEYDSEWWYGTKKVLYYAFIWDMQARKSFYHNSVQQNRTYSNFRVNLIAEQVSGGESGSYGLVLKESNDSKYYFMIQPSTQEYLFYLYDSSGEWTNLLYGYSDLIETDDSNDIVVICENNNWYFYINSGFVDEVYEDTLGGGYLGLAAGLDDTDKAVFEFTFFEIDLLD